MGAAGSLPGPNYDITSDLGSIRGDNLFHSFSQFDLGLRDVANFSGPAGIQNILCRVTGDTASMIDGGIRSQIAGANLFLLNPNGVMFGPRASVQVGGAFAASTADYLQFADDARFFASLDGDDSVLSTAPVGAFGFLGSTSGEINARGTFEVAAETSISLVGGSVTVAEGTYLESLQGTINVVGVFESGEVPFSSPSNLPAGEVESLTRKGNDIVIRGGRLVVDHAQISAESLGGGIDIALSDSMSVVNKGEIVTSNSDSTPGGDVSIAVPSLTINGLGTGGATIRAETSGPASATGGSIQITAADVSLTGAVISVSTSGAADAGRVEINASSLVMDGGGRDARTRTAITAEPPPVIGSPNLGRAGEIIIEAGAVAILDGASLSAATLGTQDAGTIRIVAGTLEIRDGGITTLTVGPGRGGRVDIVADLVSLDGEVASISALTARQDGGDGGVIEIVAGQLEVLNGAAISAETRGSGNGGTISITAENIILDTAPSTDTLTGISATSELRSGVQMSGRGGDISIAAGVMTLRNGMAITSATDTSGDGGSITIEADNVTLESGSAIRSTSEAQGLAGTITIHSANDVLLSGASSVSTSASVSSGGNIKITAGNQVQLFGDSKVTAEAGLVGGSITVNAPNLIYLLDSAFDAQAGGDGGNLNIDPIFFILNRSDLISKSSSGNGGNITIFSDYFFQSESTIDASAPFGLPGEVQVTAPEVNLSGVLVGLPGNLLDVDTLLQPDCAVRLIGDFSSFVIMGRGGLPLTPRGFVPSGMILLPNEERE